MQLAATCHKTAKKMPLRRGPPFGKEKPAVCNLLTAGVARPEGFEPPAFGIGIRCDIQLRHGRTLRYDAHRKHLQKTAASPKRVLFYTTGLFFATPKFPRS